MKKRLCTALCYTVGAIVISVLLLFISWAVFKWVHIPYTELSLNLNQKFNRNNVINPADSASSDKQI